jgi:hypothetical protein
MGSQQQALDTLLEGGNIVTHRIGADLFLKKRTVLWEIKNLIFVFLLGIEQNCRSVHPTA